MTPAMNRRTFLHTSALAGLGLSVHRAAAQDAYPPAEAITRGPGYHWFGYYDKWQVDPTGRYALGCRELVGAMPRNGHNTYVPRTNNEWVLNDTYPYHNPERLQELYLYHVPAGRKVMPGKFHEPPQYVGGWRCDLHPRCNQQGTEVFFDSTHGGNGRQMYRISIGDIVRT